MNNDPEYTEYSALIPTAPKFSFGKSSPRKYGEHHLTQPIVYTRNYYTEILKIYFK